MGTQPSNTLSMCLDVLGLYQDGDRYSLCPIREDDEMTSLHHAVQKGEKSKIESLLQQSKSLHATRDRKGRTPLLYAPTQEIAECLLEAGADVAARDEKGRGLLHYGAAKGSLELVSLGLKQGIAVDTVDLFKKTAMHYAFVCADEEMISFLKGKGANIDVKDMKGGTPLHWSLFFYPTHKKLILNQGADIETTNDKGDTLLHTACQVSDDCIRYILDNTKININAINLQFQTAVHYAVKGGYMTSAVAIAMREDYTGYAIQDSIGRTVLHYAGSLSLGSIASARGFVLNMDALDAMGMNQKDISQMNKQLLHAFINAGKITDCVNIKDKKGQTILHDAVRENYVENLEFLLDIKGVDINAQDCHGQTALHVAAQKNHEYIAFLLAIKPQIKLNMQDNKGKTPLHVAVENNSEQVVEYLLDVEVKVDITDHEGKTARDYSNDEEISRLLGVRCNSEDSSEDEDCRSIRSPSP